MSTEQEDAAMLLELQEKITYRIREQVFAAFMGTESAPGTLTTYDLSPHGLRQSMQYALLNDPTFISEMTKRIGQKMQTVY